MMKKLKATHAPQDGPPRFRRTHALLTSLRPRQPSNGLPYGVWILGDGRQVLFDRAYTPMWVRWPGQPASRADPNEWFEWVKQVFLHDDDPPPHRSKILRQELAAVTGDFVEGRELSWVRPC